MQKPLIQVNSKDKNSRSFIWPAKVLFQELLQSNVVLAEDYEQLSERQRESLEGIRENKELLAALAQLNLLTDYQAGRIDAGTTFGLTFGNYRVLDRLGAGGMGVVFLAEHIQMRKRVAIKVLPSSPDQDPRLLRRFLTEIRAIAQLNHPNIVAAIDAGETADINGKVLHFFVMEYVPGMDLEEYVKTHGPLAPTLACDLIHQVASAVDEAHKHHLVHRDIKPSNVLVTPTGLAKLLDFGLARKFSNGLTEHGTLLGTIDYMAPEQVQDAHAVDIRADIYGLGGILYWSLTGKPPFPTQGAYLKVLTSRLLQPAPSLRAVRPDLSDELDQLVQKLMALNPDDRYPTPEAAMRALLPFLKAYVPGGAAFSPTPSSHSEKPLGGSGITRCSGPRTYQVLVVDDEPIIRTFCNFALQSEGILCAEAADGHTARAMLKEKSYDLIVLDMNLEDISGADLCRELREKPPWPNVKIIMISGHANTDILAQLLLKGADDFIAKPFSVPLLQSRVKSLLRLKDAQDRTEFMKHQLLAVNRELEQSLNARNSGLLESRNALVLALAKLVSHRANQGRSYMVRLQKYVRILGEDARRLSSLSNELTDDFLDLVAGAGPLHDVGMVGLPDFILMKPGKLDGDEQIIMQAHTTVGADLLQEVAKSNPSADGFLQMAAEIARHHHERYDGAGYPDRLAGPNIPLASRLVAICIVYDALRARRVYKPALSQNATLQVMADGSNTQFDPFLLNAFLQKGEEYEKIYRDNPD